MRKTAVLALLLIAPFTAHSETPVAEYRIIPEQSSLTFTATVNGSPTTGEFRHFEGVIAFDRERLKESHAEVTIHMASVSASYADVGDNLKTVDWFDIEQFPEATFKGTTFRKDKKKDSRFHLAGEITLRSVSQPVTLTIEQLEATPKAAQTKGTVEISRTAFGVGQKEWKDTSVVADKVTVEFSLSAIRNLPKK